MTLTELKKMHDAATLRTPGEWGKGEGYYGQIGREDGRYVCALHNQFSTMANLMAQMEQALKDCLDFMETPPEQRKVQPYTQTADALREFKKWSGGND